MPSAYGEEGLGYMDESEARQGRLPSNKRNISQHEISFRISRNNALELEQSQERAMNAEATSDQQLKSILKSPKDRVLTGGTFRSPTGLNQSPDAKIEADSVEESQTCSPAHQRSPAERKLQR